MGFPPSRVPDPMQLLRVCVGRDANQIAPLIRVRDLACVQLLLDFEHRAISAEYSAAKKSMIWGKAGVLVRVGRAYRLEDSCDVTVNICGRKEQRKTLRRLAFPSSGLPSVPWR